MQKTILGIVVPCYNEEEVLSFTASRLEQLINRLIEKGSISTGSFICFVDDGSMDNTWQIIKEYTLKNTVFQGIKLSTNFGHQNALIAGMISLKDKVDCVVTIDADLQDNPDIIEEMIERYHQGNSIVYGVRNNRETDSFFKKATAQAYYKILSFLKVKTVYNHADFRLIDKKVLRELIHFKEVNLFLRGIFPIIGFKSDCVYYKREERFAGETKYPLRKMLNFAWDGVTSFSTFPLRLIFVAGFLIFFISILLTIWALIPIMNGSSIPGWASTVIPIFVFSGIQMIFLGVIGEYLGKIYKEIKSRPRYIIDETSF